ncbi:MAG: hypothetical protein DRP87_01065 [Spirochaetes bacterium]|nr:MAG: hypothetical protein DRP87_01065 [Spirochaetota bacterium]
MKKGTRLFLALYTGFAVYSVLTFFFGNTGILAMKELEEYRDKLYENNRELEKINRQLSVELDALQSDPNLIRLHARRLGYFEEEERVIKLRGFKPDAGYYTIGKMITFRKSGIDLRPLFRAISVSMGIIFYLLTSGGGRRKIGTEKKHAD